MRQRKMIYNSTFASGGFAEEISGWISPLKIEQLLDNKHQVQLENENWDGCPTFENIIKRDYR